MSRSRPSLSRGLEVGGLLALLGAFAVGPVVWLALRSLTTARAEVLAELTSEAGRTAGWNTLVISAGAAAFAFLLGAPLSLLLFRTELPYRGAFTALFTLPSAIPPFIWAMGWIALASPKVGLLNVWLGAPVFDVYGRWGMCFVLGSAGLPLVLLSGRAALERMDPSLEEAARLCGAGPLRALWSTTVRLALPQLSSGAGLVFLLAASAFGVPYLLGASARPPVPVLTTLVYAQALMGGEEHLARAVGLSTSLLGLATVVLLLNQVLGRLGRYRLASGKGVAQRRMPLGRGRVPLLALTCLAAAALVVLPLLAVALTSVQKTPGRIEGLTFGHWAAVLGAPRTLSAAATSLWLALAAGGLVATFGLFVSLLRARLGRLGRLLETLAAWPYALPGTVLAIALLVLYSRELRVVVGGRLALVLSLVNSLGLVLVAYAGKHLALGVRTTGEALDQLDPSLAEAARVSGAGPARALVDVVVPMLRPALATTFLLTFLTCATELTMSVLLIPPGRNLLGALLFELQSYADPAGASVLACAFLAVVVSCIGGLSLLRAPKGEAR